jgi:hypothetical protein
VREVRRSRICWRNSGWWARLSIVELSVPNSGGSTKTGQLHHSPSRRFTVLPGEIVMKDKSPRCFVATAVLGLTVGLLVPSESLDAQVTTSHPTTRSGAAITLTGPSSKDSAAVLADISAAYAAIEANIEMTFIKLKLATASTKSALDDQIRDLNALTRKLKAQMEQLNALQQKVDLLAKILQQLDQDEQKGLQDLREQQRKAIQHANELIVQRRSQDLQTYSQAIKIQIAKAGLDSVKAINSRYPIR